MLRSFPVSATIPAADLKRAKKFYGEVLGLDQMDLGENNEVVGVFIAGDDTQIMIYEREPTKAEHTAATFFVKDIESVVDGLTDKGVVFEQYDFGNIKTDSRGIATLGGAKSAWFMDTEGNIISLLSM